MFLKNIAQNAKTILTFKNYGVNIKVSHEMQLKINNRKEVTTMVNVNKLRGKIIEKGLSVAELAKKIGIDKATLYRKIKNNGETITIRDANLIIKELELNRIEASEIFFAQFVA